jgi:hypothetical protein
MPKVTTIQEIRDTVDGVPVICTRGKLTKLFPRKAGENSNGPWSIQQGEIMDATGKIDLFIKDRDDVPKEWKGKDILIESNHTDHGWKGAVTFEDTYKEVTTIKLKITPSATMALYSEQGATEQAEQPSAKPATQPSAKSAPNAPAGGTVIYGATVGMAVKGALDVLIRTTPSEESAEYFDSPTFPRDLHQIASDILRVSLHLEGGHLALTSKERAAKQQVAAQPPTQPTQQGEPADQDG